MKVNEIYFYGVCPALDIDFLAKISNNVLLEDNNKWNN